ncbi:hypothetical protein MNBD_IGNAVI01-408 [hydrothermal vent metagenome]|uniref:Uncharacterized protein n=1 Tax=hydrothermal vent metagenome TaxID=652676 RepID=A0A3B1CAU8_9ZZZZ
MKNICIERDSKLSNKFDYSRNIKLPYYLRVVLISLFFTTGTYTQSAKIVVPDIPNIKVTVGESILIPKVESTLAFQFNDGRIVVGKGEDAKWSLDNGHTWKTGLPGNFDKSAIDLGNNEIISINRNTQLRPDGKYRVKLKRSFDNWKTTMIEEGELEIPNASFTVTGSGGRVDGFLFHHGLIQLPSGELVATMYGNFKDDVQLCAGYPAELGQRKYHTIVVFSKDRGHTWGNYVHVAYDKMLGRGIPNDHKMLGKSIPEDRASRTTIVPAITMEGFREADLVQAPNSDLICVMRSGGRNPTPGVNLFPTPLYCSRSSDGGKHWTPPEQIADRGVSPNLVTMKNGIIVCTYSRPGNWLIFSDNNGASWKGTFQFGTTGSTNYIIETVEDTIQVYHEVKEKNEKVVYGTFFKVQKIN